MGLLSNKIRREQLNSGDHIYTWRRRYSYSHHGIYEGDGKVIHLTRGPDPIIFSSSIRSQPSNDRVVRCDIKDFICDGQLYRFEYGVGKIVFLIKRAGSCSQLTSSKPPEDVLHRASFLLENGFGDYNLFDKNCEDFAIYCKTGLINLDEYSSSGRSGQIASLVAAFSSVAITPYHHLLPCSFIVAPLVVCGFYCIGRLILDVETESSCAAVEVEKLKLAQNMREESTRRTLSVDQYVSYAAWAFAWYSTPKIAFLQWFRSLILDITLLFFVSDHLSLYRLKLGKYSAYTIWVLGYWYWRWTSMNTILLCIRLVFLSFSLFYSISHHLRSSKLDKYITNTTLVLGLWYWTPGNTVLLWSKLALVYILLFYFAPDQLKNHRLICRAFFVCFAIHTAALFWGLNNSDYVYTIMGITFL